MIKWELLGPWISQKWSSSPCGLQNIPGVRILSQKGRKLTKSTLLQKLFSAQVWKSTKVQYRWIEGTKWKLLGPRIPQKWSSSPYEWQNTADVRISRQKGRKFTKSTILQKSFNAQVWKSTRVQHRWIGRSKQEIKGPKISQKWPSSPHVWQNTADVRISSQKGRKFTKSTILQKSFNAQIW